MTNLMKRTISIILLLLTSIPIIAEDYKNKVALVIGNQSYHAHLCGFGTLETPKEDAKDMASALDSIGFNITLNKAILDANKDEMINAIKQFADDCENADLALFYYSGHGVFYKGENLLIPVDENFKRNDIRKASIELSYIADALKYLKCKKIIILDACRNAPDSIIPDIRVGQVAKDYDGVDVIYYATKQNKAAYQKVGGSTHSIYTDVWLKYLQKSPNEDLSNMFMWIIQDVTEATKNEKKGEQVPFQHGTLSGTLFNFPNTIDNSLQSQKLSSREIARNKRHSLTFASIGFRYPTSFELRIGETFYNWFADLSICTPFKKTSKIEVKNSLGLIIATQTYNMYDMKIRGGYMRNFNKWQFGGYIGYSWGLINGDNSELSAGGANMHSFIPGIQLEYTLTKNWALFTNIEGKLVFSKDPSVNYNEIKACCPDVREWTKPFGIGIGLRINFTKK